MKRLWLWLIISWLGLGGMIPARGIAAPGFILEIPAEVTVSGPKISLADLGKFQGGSETEIESLRRLDLGQAPLPGQSRIFNRNYLQFILQQYQGVRLPLIKMGEQVIVRVAATEISGKEIAAAVEKLLPPPPAGILKQWIQLKGLPEKVWLAQDNYRIEAATIGELPAVGRVLFKVQLVGEKETRVLNLAGVIRKSALVYRAKKALQPHTELNATDFEAVRTELVNGDEYLGGFPVQYRTVKRLLPGQILSRKAIQPLPLVAKGREVKVIVRGNGVLITLAGIAKSDGWNGETITIINPDSKKEFNGRVIAKGIVEVSVQ